MERDGSKGKVGDATCGGFSEGFVRNGRIGAEPRGREWAEGGKKLETGWTGLKEASQRKVCEAKVVGKGHFRGIGCGQNCKIVLRGLGGGRRPQRRQRRLQPEGLPVAFCV